jgi:hypothetical protein
VKKLQQICPETRLVNHNCVALRQELGLWLLGEKWWGRMSTGVSAFQQGDRNSCMDLRQFCTSRSPCCWLWALFCCWLLSTVGLHVPCTLPVRHDVCPSACMEDVPLLSCALSPSCCDVHEGQFEASFFPVGIPLCGRDLDRFAATLLLFISASWLRLASLLKESHLWLQKN